MTHIQESKSNHAWTNHQISQSKCVLKASGYIMKYSDAGSQEPHMPLPENRSLSPSS